MDVFKGDRLFEPPLGAKIEQKEAVTLPQLTQEYALLEGALSMHIGSLAVKKAGINELGE